MYSSKQIIKVLLKAGWSLKNTEGSHQQYVHPTIKTKVTVPHPKKDMGRGTFKSILAQAQMTEEEFKSWLK